MKTDRMSKAANDYWTDVESFELIAYVDDEIKNEETQLSAETDRAEISDSGSDQ